MHDDAFDPGALEPAEPAGPAAPAGDDPAPAAHARKARRALKRVLEPESPDRLQEGLSGLRVEAVEMRRKALAGTFDLAERCREMAQGLPKAHIFAFLEEECRVPRSEARRYLELAEVLGPERTVIERSAIDVTLLFHILRQPEPVREEALRMLRADRKLSLASLRAMRRDVLAAREEAAGTPHRGRCAAFKAAAAAEARRRADAFLKDLKALADGARAVADDSPGAPPTETVEAEAPRLVERLDGLVPPERLPDLRDRADGYGAGWDAVRAALVRINEPAKSMLHDPDWEDWRPWHLDGRTDAVLQWPFGGAGTRTGGRPLDTRPRTGRWRASAAFGYRALELCAGAGGQAVGLKAAGFRHAGLVEVDGDAAATLRANGCWPVIEADLRNVDLSAHRGVDLIAAGLPCQPFSQGGKGRGKEDERDLFDRALAIVAELKPTAVMIENVEGIFNSNHLLERLETEARFDGLGYDVEWRVVEGRDFGLAQKRCRTVLVALRRGLMHRFRWPAPLVAPPPTLGEALRDMMGAGGWTRLEEWVARADGLAPTIIGGSKNKGGSDLCPPKTQQDWARLGIDASGVAEEPPAPDFAGMPRLTQPMLARLQDFPDGWRFVGSNRSVRRQIANAFPPRLARVMGLSLMRVLTGEEVDPATALGTAYPLPDLDMEELARRPEVERDEWAEDVGRPIHA